MSETPQVAGVRLGTPTGRAVIAAATLGSGMAFLDGTVVNVALQTIGEDLDATLAELQWITNGYLLSLASLILLGGSLGDRFGRRRVFVIGTVWFAIASLLCGLAPNPEMLIIARVAAGRRRRAADARQPGDDPGRLRRVGPAEGDRRLVGARRHRGGHRPVRRRLAGRLRRLALDLPDQPAAGGGHDRDRAAVRAGDPRPRRLHPLRRRRSGAGHAGAGRDDVRA